MKRNSPSERRTHAETDFKRLIGYTFLIAILAVAATLFYLSLNDMLSVMMGIVTGVAVFLSFMLGGGLMALGFFSSSAGHDEHVSGLSQPEKMDGEQNKEKKTIVEE